MDGKTSDEEPKCCATVVHLARRLLSFLKNADAITLDEMVACAPLGGSANSYCNSKKECLASSSLFFTATK